MQTYEKETQLGNYVLSAKSAFVRQSHRVLPESTTTRGLIVGFFDLRHVGEPLLCLPLSAADSICSAEPRVGPRRHPPKSLWQTNLADSLGPELARQNV